MTETEFTQFFERHAHAVLAYARRRLADETQAWDVLSDTFLTAWRLRDRVPLAVEEQLPWLYTVAANALRNTARSDRRRQRLFTRAASALRLGEDGAGLAEQSEPSQLADRVAIALDGLGTRDQEVLRLVGWEGLDIAAIASVLGISHGAAKVRVHRARRRLVDALGMQDGQLGKERQGASSQRLRSGPCHSTSTSTDSTG